MTSEPITTTLGAVNARRSLAAAVLVLAAPVLSSCGGNFNQQTNQIYNPAEGVDDRSGDVDVLNALVVSTENGSGTVVATFVNNNRDRDDTLRSITGAGDNADLKVTPGGPTTIPAGGLLNLAERGRNFVEGERVRPGYFVDITFTFEQGTAITVNAPVVNGEEPEYTSVPQPTPTGSPSPSASPTETPGAEVTGGGASESEAVPEEPAPESAPGE
jgi:hypothetical protein